MLLLCEHLVQEQTGAVTCRGARMLCTGLCIHTLKIRLILSRILLAIQTKLACWAQEFMFDRSREDLRGETCTVIPISEFPV